jgi:hypothetical protein
MFRHKPSPSGVAFLSSELVVFGRRGLAFMFFVAVDGGQVDLEGRTVAAILLLFIAACG